MSASYFFRKFSLASMISWLHFFSAEFLFFSIWISTSRVSLSFSSYFSFLSLIFDSSSISFFSDSHWSPYCFISSVVLSYIFWLRKSWWSLIWSLWAFSQVSLISSVYCKQILINFDLTYCFSVVHYLTSEFFCFSMSFLCSVRRSDACFSKANSLFLFINTSLALIWRVHFAFSSSSASFFWYKHFLLYLLSIFEDSSWHYLRRSVLSSLSFVSCVDLKIFSLASTSFSICF